MVRKSTFSDMRKAPGWQPDRPYNDLPLLPPPTELETKAVLKKCVGARSALAELKKAVELIPNAAMLINTLPLLEARASSEIENIVTTADNLFRHLQAESGADPATKEALRYAPTHLCSLHENEVIEHAREACERSIGTNTR